jgi:diguanylate cyclase (GGDEF)-like protein
MLQGADERRLRVLARLGGEFGRVVSREELHLAIARLVRDEAGYDGVAIWRRGPRPDELELGATIGVASPEARSGADGLGAQLVVPLVSHGESIGAIGVRTNDPCALDEADVELLDSVAPAIAAACEAAALHESVRDAALTDQLTGLPNARAFGHALAQEVARSRRRGYGFALALIAIRPRSDLEVTGAANPALQEVALVLRAHLRSADIVARHAARDFAVLLPESTAADAAGAIERALGQTSIASSYGVVEFPADGSEAAELLAAADWRVGRHSQTLA